jgi:hypothetical protein
MTERTINRRAALASLAAAAAVGIAPAAGASEPVRLITPDEARLPAPDAASGQNRNITRGPGVDPLAPPAIGVGGEPFRLAVRFKPRNGVAIDPAKVRITYRRQPAIDLSARLKPFITAEGIEAPAVIVPPGRHVIEIEATDKEGRLGRGQMTLTVKAAQ